MKSFLKITIVGFFAGFGGAFSFYHYMVKPELQQTTDQPVYNTVRNDSPVVMQSSNYIPHPSADVDPVDFSAAAARAIPSVVFINSISRGGSYSYWDWFFGEGGTNSRMQVGTGSGVIFSSDGYIV